MCFSGFFRPPYKLPLKLKEITHHATHKWKMFFFLFIYKSLYIAPPVPPSLARSGSAHACLALVEE